MGTKTNELGIDVVDIKVGMNMLKITDVVLKDNKILLKVF